MSNTTIQDIGEQQNIACSIAAATQCIYTFAPQAAGDYEHTFELADNSVLNYHVAIIQPSVSLRLKIVLRGAHARAQVQGVYIAHNHAVSVYTEQIHYGRASFSSVCVYGIVAGTARTTYRGLIHVAPSATQAHAAQENKNMLVDESARVESVPNLEVLTNDVQCMHGSATGYVDAEQLLYLQSRGIAHNRAQQMLLEGFLQPVLSGCDEAILKSVKLHIASMIE